MPTIKVNEINIYYEIHGEGFPLVMIHGFSANINWWPEYLINTISKSYETLIFDNRGAGRTDKPDMEYSIRLFADDTADLMNVLRIERAHILGISMGGLIAQELVLNYPEEVEKLILCGTYCGGRKFVAPSAETMKILMRDRRKATQEEIIREWIPILFSDEFIKNKSDFIEDFIQRALIAPIPPHNYRLQGEAAFKFNIWRELKEIQTPTLILHGKKDIMVPSKNAEIIHGLIPNSKLNLFDNIAHLIFSEDPENVIKTVLEFLD